MKCHYPFINNLKWYHYPIVVILVILALSILDINTSSVDLYRHLINTDKQRSFLLWGKPRAIRSDQYLVNIPNLISQDINNEPIVNSDMGEGTNISTQNYPSNSIFSLFKITNIAYFFSTNSAFSYSFSNCLEIGLFLLSTYFLLLEITKGKVLFSIFGSQLFLFTPFTQWWNQYSSITWLSFGLFLFLRLMKKNDLKKMIFLGFGLSYVIITFALILYPPFQIPLMYVAIFLAVGILLKQRMDIVYTKQTVKKILMIFFGVLIITSIFLLIYYYQFKEVIEITSNTVYPGARFISAGYGSLYQLFNGFYNILMQKDSNGAPFANQSEASNFFLLTLPLIGWILYKGITLFKEKRTIDYIGLSITASLIFLSAFYFLPLPDFLSKYTGMYMVPATRMYIGMGFANYLLIFYMLTKNIYKVSRKKILDLIIAFFLIILTGFIIYKTGHYYYNLNPQSFEWPTLVSPDIKILMVTIFVSLLMGLLLFGYKKIFVTLFLLYGIASTIYINPLYKGLDILINTDLANYIEETSTKDDSKWIAYNNNMLAQYALANNASIINGIHLYPQFEIWEVLDPEKKYIDIYNRYAHINISEFREGEEYIRLLYPDALEVNISPCDKKWDILNVKYIITYQDMSYSCLELRKNFPEYGIKIYDRNLVITQP